MGLSATLQSAADVSLLKEALGKVIYNYSFEQALRHGTVCDFVIFQIALQFLPEEREEYENITEEMRGVATKLYAEEPDLGEKGVSFFQAVKTLAEEKQGKASKLARTYLMLAYRRKRLACLAENRVSCACRLLRLIGTKERCILFGESIEQAEMLYHMLRDTYRDRVARYHSRMGKQANRNALERFRDGEVRVLISCRALDEGVDVPEATVGIILSGTSVERQRVQRLGRILRSAEEKKVARLYYLYIRESREEKSYFPMRGENFKALDLEYDADSDRLYYADPKAELTDF